MPVKPIVFPVGFHIMARVVCINDGFGPYSIEPVCVPIVQVLVKVVRGALKVQIQLLMEPLVELLVNSVVGEAVGYNSLGLGWVIATRWHRSINSTILTMGLPFNNCHYVLAEVRVKRRRSFTAIQGNWIPRDSELEFKDAVDW